MQSAIGPVLGNCSRHRGPGRHVSHQISHHRRLAQEREGEHAHGPHGGPRVLFTHRRPEAADVVRMRERVLAQHDVLIRIVHVDAWSDFALVEDVEHRGGNGRVEGNRVERGLAPNSRPTAPSRKTPGRATPFDSITAQALQALRPVATSTGTEASARVASARCVRGFLSWTSGNTAAC